VAAALLTVFSGSNYAALSAGSMDAQESPTLGCVPFVAKLIQRHEMPAGSAGTMIVRGSGIYARNSRGLAYQRVTLASHSPIPIVGQTDHGVLVDAPRGIEYLLDFNSKIARRVAKNVTDRAEPIAMTREQF